MISLFPPCSFPASFWPCPLSFLPSARDFRVHNILSAHGTDVFQFDVYNVCQVIVQLFELAFFFFVRIHTHYNRWSFFQPLYTRWINLVIETYVNVNSERARPTLPQYFFAAIHYSFWAYKVDECDFFPPLSDGRTLKRISFWFSSLRHDCFFCMTSVCDFHFTILALCVEGSRTKYIATRYGYCFLCFTIAHLKGTVARFILYFFVRNIFWRDISTVAFLVLFSRLIHSLARVVPYFFIRRSISHSLSPIRSCIKNICLRTFTGTKSESAEKRGVWTGNVYIY